MVNASRRIARVEESNECIILERSNGFVVRVLAEGRRCTAYINNTGRLLEYLTKGRRGFCLRARKPGKTDCRLFAVEEDGLGAVLDTQIQVKVFEKASAMRLIPWIKECRILRRNVRLGGSLMDYLLECDGKRVYLEVKSAVLRQGAYAAYPDCPSARGRKHVKELLDHVKKGGSGIMLFIAALLGWRASDRTGLPIRDSASCYARHTIQE